MGVELCQLFWGICEFEQNCFFVCLLFFWGVVGGVTIFALKMSGGGLVTGFSNIDYFVLGTSNKGQGGLFTSFSITDYLYTGNQQLCKNGEYNIHVCHVPQVFLGVQTFINC